MAVEKLAQIDFSLVVIVFGFIFLGVGFYLVIISRRTREEVQNIYENVPFSGSRRLIIKPFRLQDDADVDIHLNITIHPGGEIYLTDYFPGGESATSGPRYIRIARDGEHHPPRIHLVKGEYCIVLSQGNRVQGTLTINATYTRTWRQHWSNYGIIVSAIGIELIAVGVQMILGCS